ncbi:hypothetical protein HETIRDRAFT_310014 [Heterobasidion irregulare TC 32-1]|uniref:RRN6 beta-propeller domain-containing protein n=1 Tax=Heterobasidion irregulare (strain TC 32-1) TaxID=747525 RepID=W4KK13_HETIT|nr:uncharacterized protein HETIRDRAFT_310014 [Heterobasidion irregulare TC 32-1]ETW86044.1 hypothetical protein HETIRDRAFT_310014 [Heterobasidion irregulare TC 32-1]
MFSTAFPKDLITSIERVQRDGLMRICTTREILCLDERYPGKPVLAFKHSRQFDRTLQARTLEVQSALLTILTSRKNGLMTVYDVSRETSGLTHTYASPYSLPMPMGPMEQHAGYVFVQPPDGSGRESMSMFQLSSHGSVHQLDFLFSADDSGPKDAMDGFAVIEWSEEVEELGAKAKLMRTEAGPLGSRNHAGGGIFPKISAEAFYETLDKMPTFWQDSDEPIEHMLTTFDIAFRSGNEPSDPGRADFLTQSAFSTTRGYRAFVQDRIPLRKLAQQVPWHRDITPFLQRFVPEMEELSHRADDSLRGYDLAPSDERPGLSLRRESEAREQLTLDLALSTDIFSVQPFSKQHALDPFDEAIETMSRATEAISLTDTADLPQVHFGYLNPVPQANHYTRLDNGPEEPSQGARAPLGVRLLLKEWDVGADPNAYVYHDPYGTEILDGGDIRRAAPVLLPPIPRQQPQSQRPPMVVPTIAAGPPIVSPLRDVMQESQDSGFGGSQEFVTNTQIVPGPFGARQTAGKKKVGKKRIGGF